MEINDLLLLNDLLLTEINKYKETSINELLKKFEVNETAKNANRIVFNSIINASKNKTKIIDLIDKSSAIVKTVNLEWNSNLKESMSLNVFKYEDLVNEVWETSTLREYFINHVFIFFVIKKAVNDAYIENVKIWKMPENILDTGVKDVWQDTQNKVKAGKIVNYIDDRGRYVTFFLKSRDTKFLHVRPHAQNRNDTLPLPVPDKTTGLHEFMKYSFWLNSNFIRKIVVEGKYYD